MRNIDESKRIESEAGIIATLIQHPDFYFHEERLSPSHFADEKNKYIYAAIVELVRNGIRNIDPYNVIETLSSMESTKKRTDISAESMIEFFDLSQNISRHSQDEYKMLVENVLDAAFRRDAYSALKRCESMCLMDSSNSIDIQKKIYNSLDNVIASYSSSDNIQMYKDVVDELWEEIHSRQADGYAGIPFKFPALNDYVTIEKGELVIFGAQQKVGKSIMLLNCAVDLLRQGYSVLYIDSELSSRLFTARLLSNLSGVEYRNLTSGHYTADEESRIMGAKEWIKTKDFCHLYMPFFDSKSIYTAVKRINHIKPIDVLIIDYFKATGNELDAYQTYAAMGKCVDVIKNEIAGAMNIAAIGAAQATINNKLADSAKIARNASTIIMLVDKTPEEIEDDGVECGNKKMVVTVNRNGMQHASGEYIDLYFDGNKISYEQASRQHTPVTPF